jgi:CxxC-x17-CxxC domain-containing protein
LGADDQNTGHKKKKQQQQALKPDRNESSNSSKPALKKEKSEVKPQRNEENLAICYSCGKETYAPFKPDGIRPVYCKECLTALKNDKEKEIEERKKKKEEELKRMEQAEDIKKEEGSSPKQRGDDSIEKESQKPEADEGLSLQEAVNMEPVRFNHKNTDSKKNNSKPDKTEKQVPVEKKDNKKKEK